MKKTLIKQISFYVMAAFYLLAGINHFRIPETYMAIVPSYLGDSAIINVLAGIGEIFCAVLLFIPATKRWGIYGVVAMLIAFIPAHIYMIQANCSGAFCLPVWILWVRLLLLQPLLIVWAWWNRQ